MALSIPALKRKLTAKAEEIARRLTPEEIMTDFDWQSSSDNPEYAINGKPREDRVRFLATNIVSNSMYPAWSIVNPIKPDRDTLTWTNEEIKRKEAETPKPEYALRHSISVELLHFLKESVLQASRSGKDKPGRMR